MFHLALQLSFHCMLRTHTAVWCHDSIHPLSYLARLSSLSCASPTKSSTSTHLLRWPAPSSSTSCTPGWLLSLHSHAYKAHAIRYFCMYVRTHLSSYLTCDSLLGCAYLSSVVVETHTTAAQYVVSSVACTLADHY